MYPKGIEMKPNVALTYNNLGGQYTRFVSKIGVSDYCGTGGVQFKVFLNGSAVRPTRAKPQVHRRGDPDRHQRFGATSMKIQLDKIATSADCYFSDWADARLLGNTTATVPGPPTSVTRARATPKRR